MSKTYETPSWGANPIHQYYIEILKEGSIISTINLIGKDHFIIGRLPDACDIVLEHQSISRQHAVFQFRDDGALMLFDWSSAQGTFINKKQLPQNLYQKLYVGDIIKFGASTRQYIINGPDSERPPEYDSENMKSYRSNLVKESNQMIKEKETRQALGISWGFDDDAVNETINDDDKEQEELPDYVKKDPNYDRKYGDKFKVDIKESDVNEKDKQIYDKIKAKELKIQNMQEENRRIYMKESSQETGLTEGQVAAVTRNDNRIQQLTEEIEELKYELNEKNDNRSRSNGGGSTKYRGKEDLQDEDDILDLTNETADVNTNWRLRKKLNKSSKFKNNNITSEVLTYETLKDQVDEISLSLEKVRNELECNDAIIKTCSGNLPSSDNGINSNSEERKVEFEDDNELENVLRHNQLQDALVKEKSLLKQQQEQSIKLRRYEKLLKIATPALPSLISSKPVSSVAPLSKQHTEDKSSSKNPVLETLTQMSSVTAPVALYISSDIRKGSTEDEEPAVDISDTVPATDQPTVETARREVQQSVTRVSGIKRPLEHSSQEASAEEAAPSPSQRQSNEDTKSQLIRKHEYKAYDDVDGGDTTDDRDGGEGQGEDGRGVPASLHEGRKRGDRGKKDRARRVLGPTRPSDNYQSKATTQSGNQTSHTSTFSAGLLEGGDVVWVPPVNQTGDGRTKLNEKLGY